ncbi:MAG: SGNH/GDSL hydrolase family protein [Clostridiales bacterium]|jgi:lysophospholipase L1-like esterase|nr:SGNH/GDSL hydrolase family protein [Clostridiales bacterium]
MQIIRKIEVFGDSILKGVQLNRQQRYCVDNHIDTDLLSRRFGLKITNRSKMGCTVIKGAEHIERFLRGEPDCRAIVMDFGGNDCDFNWEKIAADPDGDYEPHTPLALFEDTYHRLIEKLKLCGIVPILTNLPPLEPQQFFDWFCRNLNKANVLKWMGGSITTIYRFQESYSRAVERIARSAAAPLADLRGAFLCHRRIDGYLCEDGIHPNTDGQGIITSAFMEFADALLPRCSSAPA